MKEEHERGASWRHRRGANLLTNKCSVEAMYLGRTWQDCTGLLLCIRDLTEHIPQLAAPWLLPAAETRTRPVLATFGDCHLG